MPFAGTIKSHKGDGLYSVEIFYNRDAIEAREEWLVKWLGSENTNKLEALRIEGVIIENNVNAGKIILNDYIDILSGLTPNTPEYDTQFKLVTKHTKDGLERAKDLAVAFEKWQSLDKTYKAYTLELSKIQNEPILADELRDIWCIDKADGVDGREIYAVDSVVEIWCLNYNPEYMLLPPLNITLNNPPLSGVFNVMRNTLKSVKPESKYVNVALESGFARWKPQLLQGIFNTSGGASCAVETITFPVSKSRLGHPLLSGTYEINGIEYFANLPFANGDKVVCQVTFDDPKTIVPTITLIGFMSNPKGEVGSPSLLGQHAAQSGSFTFGPGGYEAGEEISEGVFMPDLSLKVISSGGATSGTTDEWLIPALDLVWPDGTYVRRGAVSLYQPWRKNPDDPDPDAWWKDWPRVSTVVSSSGCPNPKGGWFHRIHTMHERTERTEGPNSVNTVSKNVFYTDIRRVDSSYDLLLQTQSVIVNIAAGQDTQQIMRSGSDVITGSVGGVCSELSDGSFSTRIDQSYLFRDMDSFVFPTGSISSIHDTLKILTLSAVLLIDPPNSVFD